ncbi:TBC1 domain protein [Tritrichomonas foetus]|uniref:TBC1 domain protein n=1 Tax=Tritrichomonas foetus TaxID=1144522 RepID=A0A1J4KWT6_9EUKA|nr:TBC1 domain protein [Tritrichomonas foetus]|eukprot:OHT14172.1 TBC1 domain protein [Tritrichomonas foetus]
MNNGELTFKILPLAQMKEDGSPIDIEQIRSICAEGLSKYPPEDRLIAWGLLIGSLPEQAEEWPQHRAKLYTEYKNFMNEFGLNSYENKIFPNSTGITDFGLSDNHIMGIIHGDIIRTGHHLHYLPFPDETVYSNYKNKNINSEFQYIGENFEDDDNKLLPFHVHMRRIERILYIFAKLNRTLSYMQGFNEIVTVLYYVSTEALNFFYGNFLEIETFVFYTFQRIISSTELNELFTTQDHSSLIHKKLGQLMNTISRHFPEASHIINKMNIHPLQFCYRRLNLLFAQDQDIPNLMIVWDAIFAHFNELVEFEFYLILAHVKLVEPLIDGEDYSQTMIALQKLNVCDPKKLVDWANKFWEIDHRKTNSK